MKSEGRVDVDRCSAGRGARFVGQLLRRPIAVALVALVAAGCGAPGGPGEDTGRRGSGMNTDDLPMSDNIEDRRNWQDLGYDADGNAYSQDSVTGDVFKQPWQPSDTGDGYAPGWGEPEKIDKAPDELTDQPPEAGEDGNPVWDDSGDDNADSGDSGDAGDSGGDSGDSGDDGGDSGDDGADSGGDGGYDDGGYDDGGGDDGGGDY